MFGSSSDESTFVLAPNVRIVEAEDLPPTRRSLLLDTEAAILEMEGGRHPAITLDRSARDLLRQFEHPKSLREGVASFAASRGLDVQSVLRANWDLLSALISRRAIINASATSMQFAMEIPAVGVHLGEWELIELLRRKVDFAVYFARNSAGHESVVKLQAAVDDNEARVRLHNEHDALRRLAGRGVPNVLWFGDSAGHATLVTERCDCLTLSQYIWSLSQIGESERRQTVLRLVQSIARLYAGMHATDVLHGDVHPGNLLVSERGDVVAIDFDAAVVSPLATSSTLQFRVNPRFLAPELARQLLRGETVLSVTARSEQFSIAAVLFYAATGTSYTRLPLEKVALLKTVANPVRLTFAEIGQASWPALEDVLHRALATDPTLRFPDLAELSAALDAIESKRTDEAGAPGMVQTLVSVPQARTHSPSEPQKFFDELCDPMRVDQNLQSLDRRSGLWNGAAGIAYALWHAAILHRSSAWTAGAMMWAIRARVELESNFHSIDPTHVNGLAEGAPGVFAIEALVAHAAGMKTYRDSAVQRFVVACQHPTGATDLLHGTASLLYACGVLQEHLGFHKDVQELGASLESKVLVELPVVPFDRCDSELRLGIAHGVAGQLFALLKWAQTTQQTPQVLVSYLEALRDSAFWNGNIASWPARLEDPPSQHVTWWCNGTAGLIWLWLIAEDVFPDRGYKELAVAAGEHVWSVKQGIADLCCGLAGRSLALRSLGGRLASPAWMTRASELAAAADGKTVPPPATFCLAKGRVGNMLTKQLQLASEENCYAL